jgi:GTP-binding protein YchF
MKIGFIGLPKSGKTTLFNALTGSSASVSAYSAGPVGPNLAAVKIGDARVTALSAIYRPKRIVYPTIDIVDLAGVSEGDARSDAFSGDMLKLVRGCDALAIVLRGFGSDLLGEPSPLVDLKTIEDELLIADLIVAEKRLEKIEAGLKKGLSTPALKAEEKLVRAVVEALNAGRPVRALDLDADGETMIRRFQFLTKKQVLVILNSHEALFGRNEAVLEKIGERYRTVEFAGEFEMELTRLDEESARAFMEDMGIRGSARDRLTALAYDALGYISFFTVGEDEVRAWNVRRNATAVEAAAAIHSDLARGFIAAECFKYDDLVAFGSEKAVKDKGKFLLAGKNYSVKDGDILSIRFNV